MAPRADIIAVVDDNETETSVVDAASFIYQIAQERGQPAVVNLSAGTHFGPHDDSGLEVQALDALVEAAPGRAFVASAGNEGSDFIHWGGFPLEQDSLWTYYYVPREAIFEDDTGGDLLGFAEFFSIVSAADVASTFIAMGIDRIAMLLAGEDNLREVIAFPKTQGATDLLFDAPSSVAQNQLDDLHLKVVEPKS